MIKVTNVYLADYITSIERDKAYELVNMLLSAQPIKSGEKTGVIEGIELKLTYNRTKLKKEANLFIKINNEFCTAKYIQSKLNHYDESISNTMTAFILSNEEAIEKFIME